MGFDPLEGEHHEVSHCLFLRHGSPSSVRLPVEEKPGIMLELQAALLAVRLPPHDDQRGHEAKNLEFPGKPAGIPDLTVFGFQVRY